MGLGDRIDLKDNFMQKQLLSYSSRISEGRYEIELGNNKEQRALANYNLSGKLFKSSPVKIKAKALPIYALMELITYNESVTVKIPESMMEFKELDEYDFNFLINDYGNEFMIVFHCVYQLYLKENKSEREIFNYLNEQGVFVSLFFEYMESFCIKNSYRPPIHISSEKKAQIRTIDRLSKDLQSGINRANNFNLFKIFHLWEQYNILLDTIVPGIKLLERNLSIIESESGGIAFLQKYNDYKTVLLNEKC